MNHKATIFDRFVWLHRIGSLSDVKLQHTACERGREDKSMPNYSDTNVSIFKPRLPADARARAELRKRNNPNDEPVGPYTGRCAHCGSNNIWDDNLAYGCSDCGALLGGN